MKSLLSAIVSDLETNLTYLKGVNVVDDEDLPPAEIGYPQVVLKDGDVDRDPQAYGKNTEMLTARVTVYQSVVINKPGAAVMGEASLGDAGKGTLDIGDAIKTRLHKNTLSLSGYVRARFRRQEASQTVVNSESGEFSQRQTFIFEYLREISV